MQIKNNFRHPDMEATRSGWFECSCCPTNLARFIPSVPGYIYAQNADNLYVNLFISGHADLMIANKKIEIIQKNNYPWDGQLSFIISPATASSFNLLLRIPGWVRNEAIPSTLYQFENESVAKPVIKVNGQTIDYTIEKGYVSMKRTWRKNDQVEMTLPMEVRKIVANTKIPDDIGKIALQRGPLVYCGEWVDNFGKTSNIILHTNTRFTNEYNANLLNGVVVLKAEASAVTIKNEEDISTVKQSFTAIPYYSWANRGTGEMMVWFPIKVNDVELLSK